MTEWLLGAARVVPIFLLAPFFGGRSVPLWVRVLLALAFAGLLAPVQPAAGPMPLLLVREAAIGLLLGFLVSLPLWAAEAAGSLADPRLARFALLLATTIFFVSGGHLAFVRALAASYEAVPLVQVPTDTVLRATAKLIASAVGLAAPVLAAQVIAFLVLALLGRATPAFGAVRAIVVPFAFLLSLSTLALLIRGELAQAVLDIVP